MQRSPFVLFLSLLISGNSLAATEQGVISNYSDFADQLRSVNLAGGYAPQLTQNVFNSAQPTLYAGGKFSVRLRDDFASRLARHSPSKAACPQVNQPAGMQVFILNGLLLHSPSGTFKLSREGSSGNFLVSDVWAYASQSGWIKGVCNAGSGETQYNVGLNKGWNTIRIYVDDTNHKNVIQNVKGGIIAWKLQN